MAASRSSGTFGYLASFFTAYSTSAAASSVTPQPPTVQQPLPQQQQQQAAPQQQQQQQQPGQSAAPTGQQAAPAETSPADAIGGLLNSLTRDRETKDAKKAQQQKAATQPAKKKK